MRLLFFVLAFFLIYDSYSQPNGNVMLSGVVIGTDSIPIPDVAIINTRTGIAVRTNSEGFFRTEITAEDSLCIFHIAYKRLFINKKDNGRYIVIEPDIQELMQVNITNKNKQEQKNLDKTLNDIRRLAPMKIIPEYDMKSRQSKFIEENGTHNKGFSPFFGPTFHIPFGKLIAVAGTSEKRQKKKLTSHYHLVKKKK